MKKISFLILFLVFYNCEVIREPIFYVDYYITNNTSEELIITASYLFSYDPVPFLTDQINPGRKEHVYTEVETTGGHGMPSNAFYEFIIYVDSIASDNIVYSGVNDKDWSYDGKSNDGHSIYNLTIE